MCCLVFQNKGAPFSSYKEGGHLSHEHIVICFRARSENHVLHVAILTFLQLEVGSMPRCTIVWESVSGTPSPYSTQSVLVHVCPERALHPECSKYATLVHVSLLLLVNLPVSLTKAEAALTTDAIHYSLLGN